MGYSLDSDYQGLGYATEALREVVRLGFEELDLHRIRATTETDTRNRKSWKVLERVGFLREKRLCGHTRIRGIAGDSYLYAIHRDERGWRGSVVGSPSDVGTPHGMT